MAISPEFRAHQEWIGLVQPVGLVVSPPALLAAQAHVNRNIIAEQQGLLSLVDQTDDRAVLYDFRAFTERVLGWEKSDLVDQLPDALSVPLPEFGDMLRPTIAMPDPENTGSWLLLIELLRGAQDFDATPDEEGKGWHASPQLRFERLLREAQVPIGILAHESAIRLVYAPRGESSGHLTFQIADMTSVAGRPILAALHMLLSAERLFALPTAQRLPALLRQSRKYQNDVSTRLAGQVLESLYELQRGFQAADDATRGELLREVLREAPTDVYGALLTTILRLVFILYAEDRGLLPTDAVYVQHYSVGGLYERLREDAARYPGLMDQRFGAWPQLLTLFRMLHDGASHGGIKLPAREGRLFDPDAYAFLEGRPYGSSRSVGERLAAPRVPDGVIFRILEKLLILDGDRLSYRALDVEQIGSVYEAMMGFTLITAKGVSIAVGKQHDIVDLDTLLKLPAGERVKSLENDTDVKLTGKALEQLKSATSIDDLLVALARRLSPLTPRPVPKGAMLLQPTEERRRSGSHYTPRSLTEPIVRTTLRPIFEAMGDKPRPEQILELNVCDPAMGSGAFLVETCRHLAEKLVEAWQVHGQVPAILPDDDLHLHARRLIAQRCLYGVDRNPFAVNLAKLSLWLVTLAKDHPFTFLDHALRQGDSLVGFTREQIASFNWEKKAQLSIVREMIDARVREAENFRQQIESLAESDDTNEKQRLLQDADDALRDVKLIGDALAAAFFGGDSNASRKRLRTEYGMTVHAWLSGSGGRHEVEAIAAELNGAGRPVTPFHWKIEFPEIFGLKNPGFDAFVGNPPFLGGKRISTTYGDAYRDLLALLHEGASSNADLAAHFYRRTFGLLATGGTFGLLATNTIAQGDTRRSGLRWICQHGGKIYSATKRIKWPGLAAVVVSAVHVSRGDITTTATLDDRPVSQITAFLFHAGGHDDPARLSANFALSYIGSFVNGIGFVFDDEDPKATALEVMRSVVADDPRNAERIFPYIGGEELLDSPTQAHRRYIIDFGDLSETEARKWPDLYRIVEAKVKPGRSGVRRDAHRERWWQYGDKRLELYSRLKHEGRALVNSQVASHLAFAFQPTNRVFAHTLNVFVLPAYDSFAVMQSRPHDIWARFFGSSMKDDLRYTPSDCFETFPFPDSRESTLQLEQVGRSYYEFRAGVMARNDEGLTATYNRFHDPNERQPDILRLRQLHDEMDRAVLDAYGWTDLQPKCEFLLDYEEEEDEQEPTRHRKKPWRYRWPDEFRDEVLARLLELNRQRAVEEGQVLPEMAKVTPARAGAKPTTSNLNEPTLFETSDNFDNRQNTP